MRLSNHFTRFLVFILLLAPVVSWGDERETLRGLSGVYLMIEDLTDDAKHAGITKKDIQTRTELRLRRNGIPILTYDQWILGRLEGFAHLYVHVNIGRSSGIFGFGTSVKLSQMVQLMRDPSIVEFGYTWQKSFAGIAGSHRIREGILETLDDLIDTFSNDFLSVNPQVIQPGRALRDEQEKLLKPLSRSVVKQAQQRLVSLGYNAGQADGVLGPKTRDALRAFQRSMGLPETGEVDDATTNAMGLGSRPPGTCENSSTITPPCLP